MPGTFESLVLMNSALGYDEVSREGPDDLVKVLFVLAPRAESSVTPPQISPGSFLLAKISAAFFMKNRILHHLRQRSNSFRERYFEIKLGVCDCTSIRHLFASRTYSNLIILSRACDLMYSIYYMACM